MDKKDVVLNVFNKDAYCFECKKVTEHNVQVIAENGDDDEVADYATCDICSRIEEYETGCLSGQCDCCNCGNSGVTDEDELYCTELEKIVDDNCVCSLYN